MRWSRAVYHLEQLAGVCADMATRPATIFPLRVTALWTFADVLAASRDDLDRVRVVLAVDLPADEVAWLCPPRGAEHWSHAAGLSTGPFTTTWRSTRAPLWNHRVRRPLRIWDEHGIRDESGDREVDALAALRNGTSEELRLPEPAPAEMASRLQAELVVSRRALESGTSAYEDRRFAPGKLEPIADALWRASAGYLDVLAAIRDVNGPSGPGPGQREA
jgi:hypothetical protein